MVKLLLMSILIAPIAIAVRAAKVKDPRRGFRQTIVHMLVFNAVYLFALMYIYMRLL